MEYCTPYLCIVDDPEVQVLRPLGYLEDVHYQQLPLSPTSKKMVELHFDTLYSEYIGTVEMQQYKDLRRNPYFQFFNEINQYLSHLVKYST
jgi:hypothetical protein